LATEHLKTDLHQFLVMYAKNDNKIGEIDKNIVFSKFLSYFSQNQMTILDVDLTIPK
jgi:hypothetical protein